MMTSLQSNSSSNYFLRTILRMIKNPTIYDQQVPNLKTTMNALKTLEETTRKSTILKTGGIEGVNKVKRILIEGTDFKKHELLEL